MFCLIMLTLTIIGVSGIFAVKNGYFNTGSKKRYALAGFVISQVQHEENKKILKQIQKKNPGAYLYTGKYGPCIRVNNTNIYL